MATTTKNYAIMQKLAADEFLKIHPETDAEIVLLASEKLTSTNVKDAVEELYDLVEAITGGGVVTGVKGSAETEYRMGNVDITKENIGLGNVDNTADADKPISTATQEALDKKQDTLTFDTTPTADSTNPVTSGGVYSAVKAISDDLANYYTKTEIDSTVDDLEGKISAIPKFAIEVVDALPTEDISETTVYLVKTADESGNMYTEHIYVNGEWEELGTQKLDLTDYVTTDALNTAIADFLTETDVNTLITTALSSYYTKTEVDNLLANKQDALTIDAELDDASENPVQNMAIKAGIDAVQKDVDAINEKLDDTTVAGTYSAVSVNAAGVVVDGAHVVEVWEEGQTSSETLATGGIAFVEV